MQARPDHFRAPTNFPSFKNPVSIAERRLANIDAVLAAASRVVLERHAWDPSDLAAVAVRSGGAGLIAAARAEKAAASDAADAAER